MPSTAMITYIKNIIPNLNKSKVSFLWALLIGFLLIGINLRWEALDIVRLNQWLTRDIDRALNLFNGNYFPLAGPETTNGLRLPGPFLYVLMAIPFVIHSSYESLFNFYFLINSASLVISFFVVKKYFDFNTAFFATALQSTHLLYVEAIAFPINPTFLLPLVPFLFWSILEFSLNRNEKALPLVGLIISLGIQIHLSIATFLLVPFVWGIIFRVKVSIKTIIRTVSISLITFLPFIYYSFNSYKPALSITHVTKFDPFSSFFEPIKILTVQNTIKRLTDFSIGQGNLTNFIEVSKIYILVQFIVLNLSLLGIVLFIFYKVKRGGIKSCQKEIIVFLFFYCPALIYDLIRPWDKHFWYNYIFILPTVLLVSKVLVTFKNLLRKKQFSICFKLTITSLIVYVLINNLLHFDKVKKIILNSSEIGDYQNFNVLRNLYTNWSNELNIPIEKISRHVYVEGIQNPSSNLFNEKEIELKFLKTYDNKCLYVTDDLQHIQKYKEKYLKENYRLNLFLDDQSIKTSFGKKLLIKEKNIFKFSNFRFFRVYKYIKEINQPCYQNSSQTFPSSLYDETLLSDYFKFQKNGQNILERKINVNLENEITDLELNYIFKNKVIKYPVRFLIDLHKTDAGYRLNFVIDFFSWGINNLDKFIFKELDFYLIQGDETDKVVKKFNVISNKSFVSYGLGINKEKYHWYRNFEIRKNFKFLNKDLLSKVTGKLIFPNGDKKDFVFNVVIPIS
jgi:hypothetical protein